MVKGRNLMQKSERTALLLLATVVAVLFAVPLLGGGTMMHAYGYGMMAPYARAAANGWGWIGLIVMALAMLVFWGAVIGGVVLLAHAFTSPPPADDAGSESAPEVLRRRFAAGELTEAEYTHMREVLERPHGPEAQARPA
jgi:putative membrane protein